jgi:hypothetical protein
MKFIDSKGRLFGKLNLIDLLVILILAAGIFAVVWKVGGQKAADAATSKKTVVKYTVVCEDLPKDVCEYAKSQIGQQLVDSGKLLTASVTNTSTEDSAVTSGHENLYVTIEGDAKFAAHVYTVGSQEVRVGYEYIVKTSQFELTGLISDMEVTDG